MFNLFLFFLSPFVKSGNKETRNKKTKGEKRNPHK